MKRSLTLDFLRGFAIWMMIILHTIQHNYDLDWVEDTSQLFAQPWYVIAPVFLLAFLGSWAGLFLLISMSVNVIAMQRRINQGLELKKVRNKQLMTGVVILVIAYITEMFLSYAGFLGNLLINFRAEPNPMPRTPINGLLRGIFNWETLNAIGLSIIITSLVLYQLYKNGGHEKIKRNITILLYLSFFIILLTPVIELLIRNNIYPWWSTTDTETQYILPNSVGEIFLRLGLIVINGHLEPMFPFLATSFVGSIFGVVLSQEKPPKTFGRTGMLSGLSLMGFGILLVAIGVPTEPSLGYRPDIPWFLLGLGGQVFALSFLLHIVEFKGHVEQFGYFSTYWRRWGMLALSIYSFQIIDIPIRYLVHFILGWTSHIPNTLNEIQAIIMVILGILLWDVILRIWAKYDFKYSLEWLTVTFFTKTQGMKSDRLDIQKVIYEVEPMNFAPLYSKKKHKADKPVSFFHRRFNIASFFIFISILSIILMGFINI